MKYLEKSVDDKLFEFLQQDNRLCFMNERICDVSDIIKQHSYDMTYLDSLIGQCVMYTVDRFNLDHVCTVGMAFCIADKSIEFTGEDNIENNASKYKLQYLRELLNQQMKIARIRIM